MALIMEIQVITYTILTLNNEPYSSSSACGVSKCNKVTKGFIPVIHIENSQSIYIDPEFKLEGNYKRENFQLVIPLARSSLMRLL